MASSAPTPAERLQVPPPAPDRPLCLRLRCLEAAVVVELDGSQHVTQVRYDDQRDIVLKSNGFRVLRFWNDSVFSEPEAVVQTILEALTRPEMSGRFD